LRYPVTDSSIVQQANFDSADLGDYWRGVTDNGQNKNEFMDLAAASR
jgi:hypothetical protein